MTNCNDQLSNLPEEIVYHIYSFINFGLNHLLVTSKRLQQLCLTSPSLAFESPLHHPKSAINFSTFLENFLISYTINNPLRDLPLQRLALSWHDKVNQRMILHCDKILPQDVSLPTLETLVLNFGNVELLYPFYLGDWISSTCPHLTKLILYLDNCVCNSPIPLDIPSLLALEVYGPEGRIYEHDLHLKISCQCLKHLTIKNFTFDGARTSSVTIVGPNLRTLVVDQTKFVGCSRRSSSNLLRWSTLPVESTVRGRWKNSNEKKKKQGGLFYDEKKKSNMLPSLSRYNVPEENYTGENEDPSDPSCGSHSFKIYAPLLSLLYWKGSAVGNYVCPESFVSLENVVLDVRRDHQNEIYTKFLKKFLDSVRDTRHLEVRLASFRVNGHFANLDTLRRCPQPAKSIMFIRFRCDYY